MKKKFLIVSGICIIVTAAILFNSISINVFSPSSKCVIIDAGHGGLPNTTD